MPSATRLIVLDGLGYIPGRQFLPLDRFPFVIGRARECQLVIDSTQISRQHAQLEQDHDQILLTDLGSTNGTLVNGERLTAHIPRRLRAGDKLNLGGILTLELDDPGTTMQSWPTPIALAGLTLDEDAAQVLIDGKVLDPALSPGQFMLLSLLVKQEGRVVTREALRQYVWGPDEDVSDQTIDALVSRLRKRLNEADPMHDYIVTRRGFGLMFNNRSVPLGSFNAAVPEPGDTEAADPADENYLE